MTFVDLLHMEHTEAWHVEDKSSGFLPKGPGSALARHLFISFHIFLHLFLLERFLVLLGCRSLILALGVAWSLAAKTEAFKKRVLEDGAASETHGAPGAVGLGGFQCAGRQLDVHLLRCAHLSTDHQEVSAKRHRFKMILNKSRGISTCTSWTM